MKAYLMEAAKTMGLHMTETQAEAFYVYHAMLTEANKTMNLTRIPDTVAEAVDRNYLDCGALTLMEEIRNARTIADVGSGAGFPGIPIAILLPETHVVLMDALDKRVKFLQGVIDALGLNAEAVHIRAETAGQSIQYRESFDVATARAVAELDLLSEYMLPLVRVGGNMVAMKGPGAAQEMKNAEFAFSQLGGEAKALRNITIPGRDWQHTAVIVAKIAPTPKRYPRKPGKPEKKPIREK